MILRYGFPISIAFACGFAKGAMLMTDGWQIPAVVGLGMFASALSFYPGRQIDPQFSVQWTVAKHASEAGVAAVVAEVGNEVAEVGNEVPTELAILACPLVGKLTDKLTDERTNENGATPKKHDAIFSNLDSDSISL